MQVRSELWFPWQRIAPIGLERGKGRHHVFSAVFDGILFKLAGNYDIHKKSKKISNDQEQIQSDPTSCPQNQKGNN